MLKVGACLGSIADRLCKSVGRRPSWRSKILFVFVAVCAGILFYMLRPAAIIEPNETLPVSRQRRSQISHVVPGSAYLQFPDEYHSTGTLSLPYGDIVEPFEVWYTGSRGMSRIDYYGGMDRTYQRSDLGKYGFACKIVPEFSERTGKTFKGCLHRRGSKKYPIKPQNIIPSFKFFKFGGHVDFRGKPCIQWKHSFKIYNKINTYTLYTLRSQPYTPVRYEMMGYDTLLSSYYDHYILEYHTFKPWKFNYSMFEIPLDLKCFDFSSKHFVGAVSEINPMLEFMPHSEADEDSPMTSPTPPTQKPTHKSSLDLMSTDSLEFLLEELKKMPLTRSKERQSDIITIPTRGQKNKPRPKKPGSSGRVTRKQVNHISYQATLKHYEDILNHLFSAFKMDYKKKYWSNHEHERRKDIYRHNMRFIKSRNRQHLTYKLKPNHMTDLSAKEIEKRKGLLHDASDSRLNGGKPFVLSKKDRGVPLPEHVDWRQAGAVNHVKSQGICGSCYAFAVAGALEGAYFIKTGSPMSLSEQQIVDCTWGFGNRGCKGGYPYRAMQWILKHGGLSTEDSYGKYLAQEGYCHFKNTTIGAQIDTYMNIRKGNITELKKAVAFYGPVTILINTQPKSFKFYGSGIYYDTQCSHALDHAALAVGYGMEDGVPYWLVKNSWSEVWGDEGYIKIAMKDDNCGVAQKAVVIDAKAR